MMIVVEVGGWEHECCGAAYERNSVVRISCFVRRPGDAVDRYVESHHDLNPEPGTFEVRGRVVDLHIEHLDGSREPIEHVPSGSALRGADDEDDGHLEHSWTTERVTNDSNRYLLTIST